MRLYLLLLLGVCAVSARTTVQHRHIRSARNEFKMCVPEELLDQCNQMAMQETKSSAKIVCIPARDRFECLEEIERRIADFGVVDPEDMYIASKLPEQDFAVFEEIRTREEPDAEFRYEAVAVVHKNLKLSRLGDLAGLNSCHTGIGRNVGYKIPLTKLKQLGIIGNLAEPELSPRENELKAFSNLFNKACIVGKWSPDPKINMELKKKYANLCALCEHPEKCDYPDNFSGYDGALRCLAHNGGQIAWTKVIYVRKFFGLPVGTGPAQPSKENPADYAYLCPDGTRTPVTGTTPCRWAARPWQGYMANADVVKSVDELRRKIENLSTVGTRTHATWLEKVLELGEKTVPKENKIISPGDYLDKANYTDVVERDYGPPFKAVRLCVVPDAEAEKCRALSKSAFSRNIRPRFDCVQQPSVAECLKVIRDNGADVIALDAGLAAGAARGYNLRPIAAEQGGGSAYYAVAAVRRNSSYRSLADLRGARACLAGPGGGVAGYAAPLHALLERNLIGRDQCPYAAALSAFFANVARAPHDAGPAGALRCLAAGGGDVAFVEHTTVPANTDGGNKEPWAAGLRSQDFELLCPGAGGRAPVDQYERCHLLQAPPRMVVTSNSKTKGEIDEIRNALISTSTLYTSRPDLFRLFGPFNGKKDLLFKDSATGLVSVSEESEIQKSFGKILDEVNAC